MMPRIACSIRLALLLLCALSLGTRPAVSQDFDPSFGYGGLDGIGGVSEPEDPVSFAAQFTAATDDRPAVLMVTATIEPEWHIYSITQPKGGTKPTKLELAESKQFRPIGKWAAIPKPHSYVDNDLYKGVRIEEHEETVTWYLPIEIAEGVDPATLEIKGTYSTQACKQSCLQLDGKFVAKLGSGVPIGPIEVTDPASAVALGESSTKSKGPKLPEQPAEAGVFSAEGSVVTWYGWLDRGRVRPGDRVFLYLRAELPDHWHVNAYEEQKAELGNQPTLIVPKETTGVQYYQPEARAMVVETPSAVEGFGNLRYHEKTAVWVVPFDVSEDVGAGEFELNGIVGYQACELTEAGVGSCELESAVEFTTKLTVDPQATSFEPIGLTFSRGTYDQAAELAAVVAPTLKPAPNNLRIIEFGGEDTAKIGFVGMLGLALVGGLILNLMPCVLPVIGLKLMSFAKQGGESRSRVFLLNLAYVAGLLGVFLFLATLASLPQLGLSTTTDYDWGELNTETWFKVFMTVLVFTMALSFLGVWEIPIPGFAGSSTAAEMASREGYSGAFFKGILTTILATPCSGPFLGPVFGYTIGQDVFTTFMIFFFVGLGMALPYLVIGAFPSLVQWIPKPGAWMDTFKQAMAFMLLGTVVYLLSTLNEDYFIPTMALLVACWFACWLGGRLPITASGFSRGFSWFVGISVAAAVGFVGFGMEKEHELPWQEFTPSQLAEAQATGKPVLLEFTANWCPTCKFNLATAIDVAAVKQVVEANGVQAIKADWTDENAEIEASLEQLNSRSIPLLAIYPAGRSNEVIVLRDTVTKTQVLQALAAAGARENNPEESFQLKQTSEPKGDRLASND
ncbi:protein-disulfide reductase DsbD family protein [Aeoliella mucimassa]|uniref:Thiol:disulfide interchange protein DsbD n=1 Tax=Aeoliella mucimassa TaxID=2527972 RepID=A0A518ATL7_9BACT|nr:thioredoxin family protein [Aeoliella mucimassa]QDU58047.1 Thiol:disulfide interchange protein DsbD precursor [Aeoliella mucimassa]